MILNDAKAKYKTKKTLLQTLIDNCPMSDRIFGEICEAYDVDEETTMDLMISYTETGKFIRNSEGFEFSEND